MIDPRAIIVAVILAATFLAGWKVKAWQADSQALAVEETRKAAMQGAAEAIAGIKVENKTVYQKATSTVIERPVYRECQHDADMLQQVNQALTGEAP